MVRPVPHALGDLRLVLVASAIAGLAKRDAPDSSQAFELTAAGRGCLAELLKAAFPGAPVGRSRYTCGMLRAIAPHLPYLFVHRRPRLFGVSGPRVPANEVHLSSRTQGPSGSLLFQWADPQAVAQ